MQQPHRKTALLLAALTAIGPVGAQPKPAAKPTKTALAAELASALQACSYDGSPVAFSPPDLSKGSGDDGARVVAEIMKYTGLPQNFDVVEGKVPNAAAIIVLDSNKVPRRVIAFNKQFMGDVVKATKSSNWAPVSIMAHEIGHHLSGHTLMPGGSQPPIELEADKFSGFVLYKMGAPLADAQKALETLVGEKDGPSHPGRAKRVAAIQQGWKQACAQQSDQCDGTVVAGARPPATVVAAAPAAPAPAPAPQTAGKAAPPAPAAKPSAIPSPPERAAAIANAPAPAAAQPVQPVQPVPTAGPQLASAGKPDVIPVPGPNALPSKFDRFVMDETGLMDPGEKAKLAKAMYDFAKEKEVEIVTLVVKDLHGLSADEYAYAMMRLLRVGKMDVGNGAVLVVAPNQKQTGVALGSGLFWEVDEQTVEQRRKGLREFIDNLKLRKGDAPMGAAWTSRIGDQADYIRRAAKAWEWTVRYPDFQAFVADSRAEWDRTMKGERIEPAKSAVWRKITRVQGTVTSLNGPKEYKESEKYRKMLAERAPKGGHTVEIKTAQGDVLIAWVDAHTQKLMARPLAEGQPFSFTLRAKDPRGMQFEMLSYDALGA